MIKYVFAMSILGKGIIYEKNRKYFFIIIVLALVFPVTTFASKINHGNKMCIRDRVKQQ